MLLPIGDDQVKGGHPAVFTYIFLVLNIGVFLFMIQKDAAALQDFVQRWAATPSEVLSLQATETLLTSLFLHGGWAHLLGNMLFLWIFGDNIEATIGNLPFLLFYLLGGLAAHAGHIYFNLASDVPTVGASGAISAIMGAYLVMFPGSRIRMWFFFFTFRISAFLFLIFWIYQQWMAGSASLQMETAQSGGVAWWAHIGGFIFGVVAGFYFRTRYRPKLDQSDYI